MKPPTDKATINGPWLLIGCAGTILMLGICWFYFRGKEPPPVEEAIGRQVVDKFLAALQSKKPGEAWEMTSAEFKSDEGHDSFVRWVSARPIISKPLQFQEYRVSDFNGLKRAEYIFQPTGNVNPKDAVPVRIIIGQELGTWKVEGIFVDE